MKRSTAQDRICRELVFIRVQELWNKLQVFCVARSLLNFVLLEQRPEAIYVREFSEFNPASGALTGEVTGVWRCDNNGITAANLPELDAFFDKRFDRLEFCIRQRDVFIFYYYSRFGGWVDRACIVFEDGNRKLAVSEHWHF